MTGPRVSVVVPHYDDPQRLRWVLQALQQQRGAPPIDVVVADDGSPEPPALPDVRLPVRLVRQDRQGFRAAAARNLGAANACGDPLIFLDGDTLPAPGFVRAMVEAIARHERGHGVLAVGRRRHVRLEGLGDAQILHHLVREQVPADRDLGSPAWLTGGYARTRNLTAAGPEDFRLVISAVLATTRGLFERIGGFDASMVGYGGEDWDLAFRAWVAGADLVHAPDAVAWHDGPDLAGRGFDIRDRKNLESLALADRIPLRSARPPGVHHPVPRVLVTLRLGRSGAAAALTCVGELLRGDDVGVWLLDRDEVPGPLRHDPRVHAGSPPPAALARSPRRVDLRQPLLLGRTVDQLTDLEVPNLLSARDARDLARGVTLPPTPLPDGMSVLHDEPFLERRWAVAEAERGAVPC
ncbi:glycosyltransferase [Barrientosiimonas endolithica]|uniref:Glycosyltransferase n=1 Tax=Barrientosiimonas endolithica TaxID=1535208 RepID=A0ABM8HBR4_9MICO|nr:glycosyltransferase [Barrientosiimonas endolithica]BDZ58386.1 hypothetical protein GCM10025872_20430 [Barrientosiimonas endolithica]